MVQLLRLKGDFTKDPKVIRNNFKQPIQIKPRSKIALAGVELRIKPVLLAGTQITGNMIVDSVSLPLNTVTQTTIDPLLAYLTNLINYKCGAITDNAGRDLDHGTTYEFKTVDDQGGVVELVKREFDIQNLNFVDDFYSVGGEDPATSTRDGTLTGIDMTIISEQSIPSSGFAIRGDIDSYLPDVGTPFWGVQNSGNDDLIGLELVASDTAVDGTTLTNGGTTYVSDLNNDVPTTGGTGTGCTVRILAVDVTGSVTNIQIDNPGIGYTVNDVLTITGGDNTATFRIDSLKTGASYQTVFDNVRTDQRIPCRATEGLPAGSADEFIMRYDPRTQQLEIIIEPYDSAKVKFTAPITAERYDFYFGTGDLPILLIQSGENDIGFSNFRATQDNIATIPTSLTLTLPTSLRSVLGFARQNYNIGDSNPARIISEQSPYGKSGIIVSIDPFLLSSYDGAADANYQPNILYVMHNPDVDYDLYRLDVPTLIPLHINNTNTVVLNQISVNFYESLNNNPIEFIADPVVTILILEENEQI
jgi:hypothetical protein